MSGRSHSDHGGKSQAAGRDLFLAASSDKSKECARCADRSRTNTNLLVLTVTVAAANFCLLIALVVAGINYHTQLDQMAAGLIEQRAHTYSVTEKSAERVSARVSQMLTDMEGRADVYRQSAKDRRDVRQAINRTFMNKVDARIEVIDRRLNTLENIYSRSEG